MHGETPSEPAELLRAHAELLRGLAPGRAIDVACGNGRNALFAASLGLRTLGVDRDEAGLTSARDEAARLGLPAEFARVDLEAEDFRPESVLEPGAFAAVLVFRYLHRPLLPFIREAVAPGGLVIYETFTLAQREIDKPRNPEHLLREGELAEAFRGFETLLWFEGELKEPRRAMARLIARKPF